MKLSALTLLFSAVLVHFAAVSATQYKCDGIATFHGEDDAKNPHVPTKQTLNWMADEMLDTFATAYKSNSDMNMISERFAKFSMKRDSSTDTEGDDKIEDDGAVSFLGGMMKNLRRRWYYGWAYKYHISSILVCRWCREDDDYTLASTGYDTIEEVLTNSQEHAAWENSFCSALQTTKDFGKASMCKIKLMNCVPETPEEMALRNNATAPEIYIVSDMRNVVPEDSDADVFTLEAIDTVLAEQPFSTSE